MKIVRKHGRKGKKPKLHSADRYAQQGVLKGSEYRRMATDWYPPGCSLVWPNLKGKDAKEWQIALRCGRLTCPVCAKHGLYSRVPKIMKTHRAWRLPRHALTWNFKPVRQSQLTKSAISRIVRLAERIVRSVGKEKGVVAHFGKVEVAQGKNDLSTGEETVLFHLHLLVMLDVGADVNVLLRVMPKSVLDCTHEPVTGIKQVTYLNKPYLSNRGWNPVLRCRLITVMNDWQKTPGRKRLFWYGGFYDLRTWSQAKEAMKDISYLECLRLRPGFESRLHYIREARRLWRPCLVKWRRYHKLYNEIAIEGCGIEPERNSEEERQKTQVSIAGKAKMQKSRPVKKGGAKLGEQLRMVRLGA